MTSCGSCTAPQTCGGGGTPNVCAAAGSPGLVSTGGTISASDPGNISRDEVAAKVFDQNVDTKWYVSSNRTPWIVYDFASTTAKVVTSYIVGSGNDMPDRDPKSWVLEGSNNGSTWTAVHTQSNQVFASRKLLKTYTVSNTTGYQMYRFRVTANNGNASSYQMSELQLFGY